MSDCLLTTTLLTKKKEIDNVIRDTIDKVLVLRFGRASDPVCLHLDDILSKSAREVSKFSTIALVDIDSEDVQVYVNYFDITLVPATVFFFNAHHMKMDSGTADHTKWVGAFHRKQDFIDVVEHMDYCSRIPKDELSTSHNAPVNKLVGAEFFKVKLLLISSLFRNSSSCFKIEEEDFLRFQLCPMIGTNSKVLSSLRNKGQALEAVNEEEFEEVISRDGWSHMKPAIFRAAMKGKLIANCPLPPERIPKYELLYKDL
ncbi:hypothetical protein SADUNF_Sadunf16G0171200 [Salix dunnii]|uniref:Thioredoxin-like protein 4B n=1 Tax=Salix dunnii TaxID=1413687 RepID=A0A835JBM3_9ROSI|nr:hypothetical protein SADUNF_Sadunf16G0171200 [Salix dunnii]